LPFGILDFGKITNHCFHPKKDECFKHMFRVRTVSSQPTSSVEILITNYSLEEDARLAFLYVFVFRVSLKSCLQTG
jgi:hypothetical protein